MSDQTQSYPSLSDLAGAKHKPCILILNAFPGVGKLSVAKVLFQSYCPTTQARLIDNHLLIDPAATIHPGRTPQFYDLRQRIREVAFDDIVKLKNEDVRIVIMTTCSGTSRSDVDVYREFVGVAQRMEWALVSVTLDCDVEENKRRLQSPDREGAKKKLFEHAVLENIREQNTLLDPGDMMEVIDGVEAFTMRLDTTNKAVEDTAEVIAQFILEKCLDQKQ